MCQPYANFRWMEDTANFNATVITPDLFTGYIFEIDLECPQHLLTYFSAQCDKLPNKREENFF